MGFVGHWDTHFIVVLSAYVPEGHSVTVTHDLVKLSAYRSKVH